MLFPLNIFLFKLKAKACRNIIVTRIQARHAFLRDTTNSTEKFRGIYTVGWNYRRKRPNTVGKRPTVGIIFCPSPQFFHNFVSFHPILMFLTILESGDKTKNIGDEFKTIWLILINT